MFNPQNLNVAFGLAKIQEWIWTFQATISEDSSCSDWRKKEERVVFLLWREVVCWA